MCRWRAVDDEVHAGDALSAVADVDEALGCLELKPVSSLAVQMSCPLRADDVKKLHIYPDGSGGRDGSDDVPAWGVVIIAVHDDGSTAIVGMAAARLCRVGSGFGVGNDSEEIVRKAHSNTAEGVATAWALSWARIAANGMDFKPDVDYGHAGFGNHC